MSIVLVHGVPETDAIWDPLVTELGRDDVIRLSPPGFGAPVPDGFGATRAEYAAWLIGELERIGGEIGGEIDLVGHDWGAGHVFGAVTARPELVRSWAADVAGIIHPDYEWHDMAQLWRTPGAGEDAVAGMMQAPELDRAAMMESLGMSSDIARRVAASNDETMGRCILALYRSAEPDDLRTLWDGLPRAASRPGLVLMPSEDHFAGPPETFVEAAERAGAGTARLEGLGHWWMIQDPEAAASALTAFWGEAG